MMRVLLAGGMLALLAGCAVTEPVETKVSNESAVAPVSAAEPAPAIAVIDDTPQATQQLSEGQLARSLIGTVYERKRSVPKTVGDSWTVSTVIKPAGREKSEFLAITKDGMLMLMHATSQAQSGAGSGRFVIRDAWAVARHDTLMQAACLPLVKGKPPIFALIHRGAVDEIVLAAQVVPGTNQIAGIDAKTGTSYRCRYRAGRTAITRKLAW